MPNHNYNYDLATAQISLIYNLMDGISEGLNDDHIDDACSRFLADEVLNAIDTHGDAFMPDTDQARFINHVVGMYAGAVRQEHTVTTDQTQKLIMWDEFTLAFDCLTRLQNKLTTH